MRSREDDGICQIPGCTQLHALHLRVCETHLASQPVGMRPKVFQPTHPCPIPRCANTVVYEKLMCWDHWQLVPKRLKALVYESWAEGNPTAAHARHCQAAIDAVALVELRKIG